MVDVSTVPQPSKPIVDFLKVMTAFVTIAVVLIHVRVLHLDQAYNSQPVFVNLSFVDKLLEILTRYAVPVFVFISAFKFRLNVERYIKDGEFEFVRYALTRVRRLLVPYLIWSFVVLLIRFALNLVRVFVAHQSIELVFVDKAELLGILGGYGNFAYQLWFIPMIFWVSLFVIYCHYKLRLPALPFIVFILNILIGNLTQVDYMPISGYFGYLIDWELGMICAVIYMATKRPPFPSAIVIGWITVSVIRLINTNADIDLLLAYGSNILTPLILYVGLYEVKLPKTNFLYQLDYYCWPIFLIQAPFIVSWASSALNRFHLYTVWTRFFEVAIVIAICIIFYRFIIRVMPKAQHILF